MNVIASVLLFQPHVSFSHPTHTLRINQKDLAWIGQTMYQKECGKDPDKLLTWNAGESFASLGIGHFIWYPCGQSGPFEESFPAFLDFARKRGIRPPAWIETADDPGCPWTNRQDFYADRDSARMQTLKRFLIRTMPEQSLFIVNRLKDAFPKIMASVSPQKKNHVRHQFMRVADSSVKLYALIDYVNFKGEGTRRTERYNNQGWGLLQVLEEMNGTDRGETALHEFSRAAEAVLVRRVQNAPLERREHRWLPGWKNRVNGYRHLGRQRPISFSSGHLTSAGPHRSAT
ncbi:hypothetical protein [Desulfatiferula olefinivorans]